MTRNTRIFSDIDLNFTAHPVTKDITRRYDENAVKTALKNLIFTSNYERSFHSEIGSPIRAMLFEPQSPLTSASIRRAIFDMIQSFEPRVTVTEVAVSYNPDDNAVSVKIDFKIINTERPLSVDLVLERTR